MSILRTFTFWALVFVGLCAWSFHSVETSLNRPLRDQIFILETQVDKLEESAEEQQEAEVARHKELQTRLSTLMPEQEKQIETVFASFSREKPDESNESAETPASTEAKADSSTKSETNATTNAGSTSGNSADARTTD